MLHEVFLAVSLPVHGNPEITAWDDFPAARVAAAAMADDRLLTEVVVPLGERAMRRWTGAEGNQVIVYAAPFEPRS